MFSRQKMMRVVVVGVAGMMVATAGQLSMTSRALAAPEPEVIPTRWELRAKFSPLRVVKLDTGSGPKAYYYLTYTVENNSGQDVLFAPSFDLVATDGSVTKSGKGINTDTTKKIIEVTGQKDLQDQIGVIGALLQGPENAKDGIVVWPAESLRPGDLTVYAAGFSGEAATVKPPTGKEAEAVLRKTRSLTFKVPGDAAELKNEAMSLTEDKWVMR